MGITGSTSPKDGSIRRKYVDHSKINVDLSSQYTQAMHIVGVHDKNKVVSISDPVLIKKIEVIHQICGCSCNVLIKIPRFYDGNFPSNLNFEVELPPMTKEPKYMTLYDVKSEDVTDFVLMRKEYIPEPKDIAMGFKRNSRILAIIKNYEAGFGEKIKIYYVKGAPNTLYFHSTPQFRKFRKWWLGKVEKKTIPEALLSNMDIKIIPSETESTVITHRVVIHFCKREILFPQ